MDRNHKFCPASADHAGLPVVDLEELCVVRLAGIPRGVVSALGCAQLAVDSTLISKRRDAKNGPSRGDMAISLEGHDSLAYLLLLIV